MYAATRDANGDVSSRSLRIYLLGSTDDDAASVLANGPVPRPRRRDPRAFRPLNMRSFFYALGLDARLAILI